MRLPTPVFFILIALGLAGIAWMFLRVSGTFVAQGSNFVVMMNLTETGDGKIAGHYQETILENNGSFTNHIYTVVGQSSWSSVSLF